MPENWLPDKACEAPQRNLAGFASTKRHSACFKQADRVEAYFHEDDQWYPARVLKVKANGSSFLIRFEGYSEKIEVLCKSDKTMLSSCADSHSVQVPLRDLRTPLQCDDAEEFAEEEGEEANAQRELKDEEHEVEQ